MRVSKVYTYPVKGMRAAELDNAVLTKHGLPYDRRYMMLKVRGDGSYENMAVASFPELTLYFPTIRVPEDGDARKGTLTITYKPPNGEQQTINLPLIPSTDGLEKTEVTMHGSPTQAYRMNQEYNDWLSTCLGFDAVFVHLGNNLRNVLMSVNGNAEPKANSWISSLTSKASELVTGASNDDQKQITFADCAPYLIASEKSMEDIHHRLPEGQQMDISKFRPNIIVSGAEEPWEEDLWAELTISRDTRISCAHNCGRCRSINIDYATGAPGTGEQGKMLKALSSNRRVDKGVKWSPIFGRYSFLPPSSEGHTIKVGDDVVVSKRNAESTQFGEVAPSAYGPDSLAYMIITDWPGLCTK
ncbi:hypothetical protein B0A50_05254 [Salinomyces thailandicus]|uniref:MOSC domain-containing protein n=1 Tax=Salinomyces thailandicus TaxID=706561 RepID=A0A4U0TX85_9PEZI|nr:hypothetical protein B0A50_05254 [Salinomyces thailandica]